MGVNGGNIKYPTPTSTRTYNDKSQQLARNHFDVEYLLGKWKPTKREMITVLKAAVAFSAYRAEKGRLSPFPSPFNFFGLDDETPALPIEKSYRTTGLLKLALKIYKQLQIQVDLETTKPVQILCPDCGEPTIHCHIGTLPRIDQKDWILKPANKPRLVALSMSCDCRGLGTAHYKEIEASALQAYVAD